MFSRFSLIFAAIFGFTGIILGAFGAHALHDSLVARDTLKAWETGVLYQVVHAVALLGVSALACSIGSASPRLFVWVARFWVTGTLLFSGSLYGLAVGGPRFLGPITPFGGLALILGWILLLVAALKQSK